MTTNTYKDAAGVTAYFATIDGAGTSGDGWVNRMATHIDDAAFTAADPLVAVGGLYQTTIDEVDANDIGIARMTARRVLMNGADTNYTYGQASAVVGDIQFSTSLGSGYAQAVATDFDGTDVGYTTAAMHYMIPMTGYRAVTVGFTNSLAQTITLDVYVWLTTLNSTSSRPKIYTVSSFGAAVRNFMATGSSDASADASLIDVPQLAVPMYGLIVVVTPDVDPSAGDVKIQAVRY